MMRRHTIEGESMLRQVGGTLAGVGRFVRASHERYDGDWLPRRSRAGERDPDRVADRLRLRCLQRDDHRSSLPRRPGATPEALEELRRCAGSQFDPKVVAAIDRVLTVRLGTEPEFAQSVAPELSSPPVASLTAVAVAEV